MERKADGEEEGERVQSSRVTINGHDEVSQKQEEGSSVLKREIACHSLYGHLIESHLDCLKLCLGNVGNVDENVAFTLKTPPLNHPNLFTSDQSELDQFMEAYCVALNKLKEVIEEPQQESMAFINCMYSQLEELLLSDISPSSTICVFHRFEFISLPTAASAISNDVVSGVPLTLHRLTFICQPPMPLESSSIKESSLSQSVSTSIIS